MSEIAGIPNQMLQSDAHVLLFPIVSGFVRFVSPKSVQRALERFRISEIEVQDVSVMIKSLKADAPVA